MKPIVKVSDVDVGFMNDKTDKRKEGLSKKNCYSRLQAIDNKNNSPAN